MKTETEKQIYKKPLYEYRQEAERALRTIENLFGSNPWHEHQKIVGFLQGYIAGMNFAEAQIEAEKMRPRNDIS